ncbi:MAG: hypothetical protein Q7V63_05445 [Gammaproteobacteria bacterium]|nr:hypothetical protein [Gammaproteobacteria bacterium]
MLAAGFAYFVGSFNRSYRVFGNTSDAFLGLIQSGKCPSVSIVDELPADTNCSTILFTGLCNIFNQTVALLSNSSDASDEADCMTSQFVAAAKSCDPAADTSNEGLGLASEIVVGAIVIVILISCFKTYCCTTGTFAEQIRDCCISFTDDGSDNDGIEISCINSNDKKSAPDYSNQLQINSESQYSAFDKEGTDNQVPLLEGFKHEDDRHIQTLACQPQRTNKNHYSPPVLGSTNQVSLLAGSQLLPSLSQSTTENHHSAPVPNCNDLVAMLLDYRHENSLNTQTCPFLDLMNGSGTAPFQPSIKLLQRHRTSKNHQCEKYKKVLPTISESDQPDESEDFDGSPDLV